MAPSMTFVDADGREHIITGAEPINAESDSNAAELRRLRPQLASTDPAVSEPAEAKAEKLFKRREELRGYGERWNRLADAWNRQLRLDLIAAIDALEAEAPSRDRQEDGR